VKEIIYGNNDFDEQMLEELEKVLRKPPSSDLE
jgi:hypothetical protein